MDNLTLQVGQIDQIVVDDSECTDAGGGASSAMAEGETAVEGAPN